MLSCTMAGSSRARLALAVFATLFSSSISHSASFSAGGPRPWRSFGIVLVPTASLGMATPLTPVGTALILCNELWALKYLRRDRRGTSEHLSIRSS